MTPHLLLDPTGWLRLADDATRAEQQQTLIANHVTDDQNLNAL